MNRGLKIFLSFLIVFHILCLLVLPNPTSILARYFPSWLASYANTAGIHYTWKFFAPNPGSEALIIYEFTRNKDGYNDYDPLPDELETYYWPPKDSLILWENLNRYLNYSFLASVSSERVQSYLVPFLCSRHKGIASIHLKSIHFIVPSMEKVRLHKQSKREDYLKKVVLEGKDYDCKENA